MDTFTCSDAVTTMVKAMGIPTSQKLVQMLQEEILRVSVQEARAEAAVKVETVLANCKTLGYNDSPYDVQATDYILLVDSVLGEVVLRLPPGVMNTAFMIKDVTLPGNTHYGVLLVAQGGERIKCSGSYTLSKGYEAVQVYYDRGYNPGDAEWKTWWKDESNW